MLRSSNIGNVMVTSISSKVPLLKQVKIAMIRIGNFSDLIGADLNEKCVGRYFVDEFWNCPPLDEWTLDMFIASCMHRNVSAVIPTRDGELKFFSVHKEQLKEAGIKVMISPLSCVQQCLDKYAFYQWGTKYKFPVIATEVDRMRIPEHTAYVVKERFGSGSAEVGLNLGLQEALVHAEKLNAPVFQPYIEGIEYSIDVYVDSFGKAKGSIARERIHVVNGEAQITSAVSHPILEQMCERMAEALSAYGHLIFQVIEDIQGILHVVECNIRIGGASSISIHMGLDSFYWFLLEVSGEQTKRYPFLRRAEPLTQIRYAEDMYL